MKIAVFNGPQGITGEGALQAFLDAGLPFSILKKELSRGRVDATMRRRIKEVAEKLGRAGIGGKQALDSLVGISAVAVALRYFQIEKCFVRRIAIGKKGNPRTLKLLKGFILDRIPIHRELIPPSGAAILAAFCETDDAIPAMRLLSVGEGPGELRISIGETAAPYRRERVLLLETNIDDMSPQGFELLYDRLFEAGALDVWVEPILMKKMRPAFKLSALLEHSKREAVSSALFRETPTLGVRFLELDRWTLPRKVFRTPTRFGKVRVKISGENSRHRLLAPEYDDVKKICQSRGLPFRKVYEGIQKDLCSLPSFKI